jgi:hypothetical protein
MPFLLGAVGWVLQRPQLHRCVYFVKAVSFHYLSGGYILLVRIGDYSAEFTGML